MRAVEHLRWAERLDGWPDCIPRSRPRGIKALGSRYEVAVGKQLGPEARRGIWWQYRDANGPGLCQTDFLIEGEIWVVILEAKHTWTPEGFEQLRDLYIPVVEMALDKKVVGVQICKNLIPSYSGGVYNDLESAVNAARVGHEILNGRPQRPRLVTLHWRGVGPMLKYSSTKEFA